MYKYYLGFQNNFFRENNRWFLWLPVLFGVGIGIYFLLPFEPSYWWTLFVIEFIVISTIFFRRKTEYLFFISIISVIIAGFTNVQLQAIYKNKKMHTFSGKTYVEGRIQNIDYNAKGNQRIVLENSRDFNGTPLGKVRVTLRGKQDNLKEGSCAELVAMLNPFFSASIIGGYQFDRRAFFDGFSSGGYALTRALPLNCLSNISTYSKIKYKIDEFRSSITKKIQQSLPPEEASVAASIITGERSLIPSSITQNYRDSGLAHFLSISGLHMSMITAISFFFARLILAAIPPISLRYNTKKFAAFFAIFISFIYLLISGGDIPATRAFIMTFTVLLGVLFSRQAISMYMIAWAALIILIISPQALVSPSFQMSFSAVVCLIAFYEKYASPINKFLSGSNYKISFMQKTLRIIFAYFIGIIISDFIASLATLPFVIYHFNKISLYTSLANFLAGPIIGLIIMPAVLFSLILMPFGIEFIPLKIVGWGIDILNEITQYVSSLPNAAPTFMSYPLWGLLFIVFGGLWLCIWTRPWRKIGFILILIGTLSICFIYKPDFIISGNGKLVGVKDNQDNIILLPTRGESFNRQVWSQKMASIPLDAEYKARLKEIYRGNDQYPKWIDIKCDKEKCIYKKYITYYKNKTLKIKGTTFDVEKNLGAMIFIHKDNIKIKTIREYVGKRMWN